MRLLLETDGYVFSKDFGNDPAQFGESPDELIPSVDEVVFSACFLISKVYDEDKVKEALRRVYNDY